MSQPTIDLNTDVGEGAPFDDAILALVTSANVSCGTHAGNDETIAAALESARRYSVAVGAHPGFADREGFGRSSSAGPLDAAAVESIITQLGHLDRMSRELGAPLRYVKPHGALYHLVSRDRLAAGVFLDAVVRAVGPLPVLVPPGAALASAAVAEGIAALAEGFADRAYAPGGTLVARDEPHALITDPPVAARQAVSIAVDRLVVDTEGNGWAMACDSVCVHGDGPLALEVAREVRWALERACVDVRPFSPP